jgi:hypothetical protein
MCWSDESWKSLGRRNAALRRPASGLGCARIPKDRQLGLLSACSPVHVSPAFSCVSAIHADHSERIRAPAITRTRIFKLKR